AAAQLRHAEATRSLDQFIYSDSLDEAEFQRRLREFSESRANVARLRFFHEFAVRRILTPDQLLTFREIRRKFSQEKKLLRGPDGIRGKRKLPRATKPKGTP
ncbi:MAG: hypothetical protein WBD22_08580, partial [Pyrinomonadaceae bacterium]